MERASSWLASCAPQLSFALDGIFYRSRVMRLHLLRFLSWLLAPFCGAVLGLSLWPTTVVGIAACLSLVVVSPFAFTFWRSRAQALKSSRPTDVLLVFGAALTFALVATYVIGRYWTFYHLHTSVSGLGLLFLVLPGTYLLTAGGGLLAAAGLSRLTHSLGARRVGATVSMLLLAVAVVGYQIVSTTAARSAEGPGAGDLTPFVQEIVGTRR